MIRMIKVETPSRMAHLSNLLEEKYHDSFIWKPAAHRRIDNCRDAAEARGIDLHQELKSIILKLRSGYYLFHLRGDEDIDEKKVNQIHRKYFGNKTKIRLASKQELDKYRVEKGIVNPLLDTLWGLTHFISFSVFEEELVYTNDGEKDGYIKFPPSLLTHCESHHIVDFIK